MDSLRDLPIQVSPNENNFALPFNHNQDSLDLLQQRLKTILTNKSTLPISQTLTNLQWHGDQCAESDEYREVACLFYFEEIKLREAQNETYEKNSEKREPGHLRLFQLWLYLAKYTSLDYIDPFYSYQKALIYFNLLHQQKLALCSKQKNFLFFSESLPHKQKQLDFPIESITPQLKICANQLTSSFYSTVQHINRNQLHLLGAQLKTLEDDIRLIEKNFLDTPEPPSYSSSPTPEIIAKLNQIKTPGHTSSPLNFTQAAPVSNRLARPTAKRNHSLISTQNFFQPPQDAKKIRKTRKARRIPSRPVILPTKRN